MFQSLYSFIRELTEPFYTVICGNGVFFIDLWSFVHLYSGIRLMLLIGCRSTSRRRFVLLFALLKAWEIFELGAIFLAGAAHTGDRVRSAHRVVGAGGCENKTSRCSSVDDSCLRPRAGPQVVLGVLFSGIS